MLGVLWKERVPNPQGYGSWLYLYHPSSVVRTLWERADLSGDETIRDLPRLRAAHRIITAAKMKNADMREKYVNSDDNPYEHPHKDV